MQQFIFQVHLQFLCHTRSDEESCPHFSVPMSSNAITPSANSPQLISVPSKNNIFSLHARLEGHTGLVLCMSITDDGKLASGGTLQFSTSTILL